MVAIYVDLIIRGLKTIENVPKRIRKQVEECLRDLREQSQN